MAKWIEKSLGEVTAFIAKGIPPKYTEEETENTIRVLNQKCNRNFEISYNESRIHDCEKKKVPVDKMLRAGDVLINSTGTGTAGRVAQLVEVAVPTTIDGHMILIRPSDELDPIYYGYAVKSFQSQIEGLAEGSTGQTEINRRRLQDEVIIRYPSDKSVQKNIGRFLANIDEKIRINREINENLEQQLTALFIHDFADGIATASTDTCPMLGDLITVIDNRGKTPPLTTEIFDYPIIDVGALKGSGRIVDFNNCTKYVEQATYETWFRSGHPKSWDILISTVGSLAEMKIYLGSKGCIAQNVVALRATSISPLYLYQYLRFIRADLVAYNIGSVQPSIKVTHIVKHPIFVPEISKLQEFEEIARVITNRLYANYNECESLKKIRNTLLPKLMSGELDVSDLDL